jgi:Zn-finger nucleic acid-binding protein
MLNHEIICPNCGVSTKAFEFKGTRYICGVCKGWTVNLGAKLDDLEKNYGEEYFKGLNPSQNSDYVDYDLALASRLKNHKKKILWLKELMAFSDARILELGSATGDFLRLLEDEGVKALGIEISEHARSQALVQKVESFAPEVIFEESRKRNFSPNTLIAWDVWEHLENPGEYFSSLLKMFPEISLIVLTTVDAGSLVAKMRQENWRQFHPPTHINYPTKKSFELWSKDLGFKLTTYRYIGYCRPLFEYLKVFGIKTKKGKRINLVVDVFDIPFVAIKKIPPHDTPRSIEIGP